MSDTLSRPLILVTTDLFGDPVREGIRRQYLDAVIDAGGLPVQVPVGLDEDSIEALVESASGLLLTGGADVDPKLYGEEKSEQCGEILPERDEAECALRVCAHPRGVARRTSRPRDLPGTPGSERRRGRYAHPGHSRRARPPPYGPPSGGRLR